jgi:uncharacterized protein
MPDEGGNPTQDHLEPISRDECMQRLRAHGVGRLGVEIDGRVAIFPVNYTLDGESIIVRVRSEGDLDEATRDKAVAFELDHADSLYHEGWSVLAQGTSSHVTDPRELAMLAHLPLLPWGGSDRDLYLRVGIDSLGGRRIHHRKG